VGREYTGLCPFHSEKTPSFTVSADKGVFHCFGCGASGDIITFVELIEKTDFKGTLKILGLGAGDYKPRRPQRDTRTRHAAALLAGWMNEQHLKVGALLRELSQEIAIAEQLPDAELVDSLTREWEILSDLHADLQRPECAAEMLEAKDSIGTITAMAPVEPLPDFPKCTPEYRKFLAAHLPTRQKSEVEC